MDVTRKMDEKEFREIEARLLSDKKMALEMTDDIFKKLNEQKPLTPPAVARLRDEMMLENTFDSNAIGGSRLTLRETVLVVKEGVRDGNGFRMKDVLAALGYARGFEVILDLADQEIPCDEDVIKRLHQYVMLGAFPEYCGVWRDHAVRVLGAAFKPAGFREIPQKMHDLVAWYQNEDAMHPIEKASRFHAEFETIHPFADGNGRTGRLLLNFMLVREGYWPANIRCQEDRERYYAALYSFQSRGNVDDLTALIAVREAEQLLYCLKIALQPEHARQGRSC